MKKEMFLEIILMTYSYVHRAINGDAFPKAPDLYQQELMTGGGRGGIVTVLRPGLRRKSFSGGKSEGFWGIRRFFISAESGQLKPVNCHSYQERFIIYGAQGLLRYNGKRNIIGFR